MPLWLAVALSVLVAGWRARDRLDHSIDVEVGVRWLFGLLALSGWGILLYRTYHRDEQFAEMWGIAVGVTSMAERQGLEVDSAIATLKRIQEGLAAPVLLVVPPVDPPIQKVNKGE